MWLNDLQQWHEEHSMRKEQSFQKLMLGKLNIHLWEKESSLLPYTIYIIELKIDWRPKHKTWRYKTPRRKHRKKVYNIGFGDDFSDMTPKA